MPKYYLKSGYRAALEGLKTGNWSKADAIQEHNENIYKTIFNRVVSGEAKLIYQRIPGHIVFITRSTRPGVLLQISHAWINKDKTITPTGHANINDFSDFLHNTDYFYTSQYFREFIA